MTVAARADLAEIRRALALLVEPDAVVELRVPNAGRAGAASGYFDDFDALAAAAARWSGRAEGVYLTLNPAIPALLARSPNRVAESARHTTSDADVLHRRRMLFDLDPVRPAGISSTDDEHAAAIARASVIRACLGEHGWPAALLADSGNGAHLVYAVQLANDAAARDLVRRALAALALEHDDERVTVDVTTYNAARISKVYGTLAGKGADTTDRPHRIARILDAPERLDVVPRVLLEKLAALAPPAAPQPAGAHGSYTLEAIERALNTRGLTIAKRKAWNGGTLLELAECPWSGPAHARTARVILHASGAVSAGCFHASCAARGWRDLRDALRIVRAPPTSSNGHRSPWDAAQPIADFLAGEDDEVQYLDLLHSLVPGALTEWFSPRGLGKTHVLHALLVPLARAGKRVLLLDRDNPRREIKRRLRSWGAAGLDAHFRIMTRDDTPPLTDRAAWERFPFAEYDVVAIDSLDASSEGVGEQDSAAPSRAIASLLDLAHRADGPAVIVLGNTTKSGQAGRGSGIVEDRGDIVYEIRDATDFTPTGKVAWWEELPPAARLDWASRATRRRRRDTYRLALISSKHRVGPEPDPCVVEISLTEQPWTWRDVTAALVAVGEEAREAEAQERREHLDAAAAALIREIESREAAGESALTKREAEAVLRAGSLTHRAARALLTERNRKAWSLTPDPDDARATLVTRVSPEVLSAFANSADPHKQRGFCASDADTRMDTGRPRSTAENGRNSDTDNADTTSTFLSEEVVL